MTERERQAGIIHLLPLFVLLIAGGLLVLTLQRSGGSLKPSTQNVLSEEDSNSGSGSDSSGSSDNSGSGSGGGGGGDDVNNSGSSGGGGEDSDRSGSDDSTDSNSADSTESEDSTGDGVEVRTETQFTSGTRIRERIKENEERFDVYEGGRHLRIRTKDGVTKLTVEDDEGNEIESSDIEDDVETEIPGTGEERLKVKTKDGRVTLSHGVFSFSTDLPILIDQETGVLSVETPNGVKEVTVLPETAIDNLLNGNVIDSILSSSTATQSGQEVGFEETEDGKLAYVIDGATRERLLGLFDVYIPKTVTVSSEDGGVIDVAVSPLNRILDLLSF